MNDKIKKLEDIVAWQKAKELMLSIYETLKIFPRIEDYNLSKHMRECSRNIPANIAEGFGRFNYQECMQFYRIARGSLNELKSDVYCSFDLKYIDKTRFDELIEMIENITRLLNGLISSAYRAKTAIHTNN